MTQDCWDRALADAAQLGQLLAAPPFLGVEVHRQ
jgi:hypothetical protein